MQRPELRAAIEQLQVHDIGGYEWECDHCNGHTHSHKAGQRCWWCKGVVATDGRFHDDMTPCTHDTSHEDLISRAEVLALLGE